MSSARPFIEVLKSHKSSRAIPTRDIFGFFNNLIKRAIDISMSLVGLIFLSPLFIYISILIKRDSKGPVFYWGPRMGRKRVPFRILKFRTMYEDQHSYEGARITAKGDDRITRIGHWLRDTKINELPQLWNVLIGEMSLVGPRPEDVKIAQKWDSDAANEILSVRPGITSPASILYHDEESLLVGNNPMDDYIRKILPEKLRLDMLYVRYNSIYSDFDIIFWTLAILLPNIAKSKIPERYFFAGPINIIVRRYLTWFIVDLFTTLTSVAFATSLWRINGPLNWGGAHLAALGIILAVLFSSINSLLGINKVIWSKAQLDDALGLGFSCFVSTTTMLALDFILARYQLLPYPPLASMMLLTIGLFSGVGFLVTRYRIRLIGIIANKWLSWRKEKMNIGERIIIVGSGEGTHIASWLIKRHMFRTAFNVVGMVDHVDPTTYGMKDNGLWVLGSINNLPSLLKENDIGVVLSTLPKKSPEIEYLKELNKTDNIRIIFLNDLMWFVNQQVTRPVGRINYPLNMQERVEYKALYDNLTDLPNMVLFRDRMRQSLANAKRNNTQRACMFVEIKGLHLLPDGLDGNYLIKEVSNRIISIKREIDSLARINNDTFALLVENVPDINRLELIKDRLSAALSKPFKFIGQEINIHHTIYMSFCSTNCEAMKNPERANIIHCYECVRAEKMTEKHKAII